MFGKLQFWTLVVGVVSYVVKFFYPEFPLDEQQILSAVLFILGLFGIVPQIRGIRADLNYSISDLFKSLSFWSLVAGLIGFVVRYYRPDFPFNDVVILSVIVFLLNGIGIDPQLGYLEYMLDENTEE